MRERKRIAPAHTEQGEAESAHIGAGYTEVELGGSRSLAAGAIPDVTAPTTRVHSRRALGRGFTPGVTFTF